MKYLILIYHNPTATQLWASMPTTERAEGMAVYTALNADLAASGELVTTSALAEVDEARRVLVRDGQTITTDGPFAEVKEHLAGFYLVDCASLDRAVEIAARIPEAVLGTIEVRGLRGLSDFEL
ncbi:MAG TPA: YciI family protein [Pseudonocardia sp.]|nr:YciI family protein [Pseudonocardia sp.]